MDFSTTAAGSINSELQKDCWLPWIEDGDSFRSDVNDDLLLIAGPRVLLPPTRAKGVHRRGKVRERHLAHLPKRQGAAYDCHPARRSHYLRAGIDRRSL
jgi:hypothetical protein